MTVNPSAEAGSFTSHSPNFGKGLPLSYCKYKTKVRTKLYCLYIWDTNSTTTIKTISHDHQEIENQTHIPKDPYDQEKERDNWKMGVWD